jgi:hypothetical protein
MKKNATGMQLHLVLNMMGLWQPEYGFDLLPVGLEVTDILQAQLRDAQDEIGALKTQLRKVSLSATGDKYMSLTSTTAAGNGAYITWVTPSGMYHISDSHFTLADNYQSVTVLRAGIYVIDIRICQRNSTNGQYLSLYQNGTEIARCYQSDGNSYYNTSHIHEVVNCPANTLLQVKYIGNSSSHTETLGNRFTITLQHEIVAGDDDDGESDHNREF